MSYRDDRIWICDRCTNRTTTDTCTQPKGWITVQFASPPLASVKDEHKRTLCFACEKEFADFLFPKTGDSAGQRGSGT